MPEEPLIQFALGELYFTNGQFVEAITRYQSIVESGTAQISAISLNERLGSSYSMLGDFEEAVPYLEAAVKEEQTDDRLFQLAFTYLQLHENQKPLRCSAIKTLNPHYQSLYLYLAEALQEEEQLEEAKAVIEEGIAENPSK